MCINKEQIINDLSNQDWLYKVCKKFAHELADDLYQEVFLILLEKDDDWILEKYESGYWNGIVIRIALNQCFGDYTNFNKYIKQTPAYYDIQQFNIVSETQIDQEYFWKSIETVIQELEWYPKKIFELYRFGDEENNIKPRSARSISKATGISRQEILKVINEIKEKANDHFINNHRDIVGG